MTLSLNFKPPLTLQTSSEKKPSKFPIDIRIFSSNSDKRDIYRLRYRAFIKDGVIERRDDGMFNDAYDGLASTCTLGAYQGETCVGTFRLAFADGRAAKATMPCQELFGEVAGLQDQGYVRLVEFGRMVVEPTMLNTSFRTTLYATMVRAGMIVAEAGNVDYGLISVHPKLARFYEMMCGFRAMARAESYPGINAPAVLLGRDFGGLNQKRSKQNSFFRISAGEIAQARSELFPGAMTPAYA
jgi:hypothetical protein